MRGQVNPAEMKLARQVVDLMEALRKSLDQVSSGKKKTAKADQAETVKKVTNLKGAAKGGAKRRKAS